MIKAKYPTAAVFLPATHTLNAMQKAVQGCRGCDLYKFATQAVFGEGPNHAPLMMVGEQPGNEEDFQGHPFVGPAGKLLNTALEEAGIPRSEVYVTNAVKHFKFEERGKRRIHKKPSAVEVSACQPWLEAEISAVKPHVVVCLGATAAQSLMGRKFRLTQHRGEFFDHPWGPRVSATIHPSAVLRAPDSEERHREFQHFVEDLRGVRDVLKTLAR
ncbi:MAG: UdgX family uracil-DNA binding protein [Bryobacterales bacterium]|nr:UdgX family uracil-DNA binding protein [Bryobacterales bacterium]MBV9396902.1 UdgX family uracil-DNA binding protein [Bryobacterales bacterium]